MSRSVRGGKPIGWEYWGKRKGGWCVDRQTSHKMERMQHKEELRLLTDSAVLDIELDKWDVSSESHVKRLFPDLKEAQIYFDYIIDQDVLYVDGEKIGTCEEVRELLAFSYHHFGSYVDYYDLKKKYDEYLESGEGRWDFLP